MTKRRRQREPEVTGRCMRCGKQLRAFNHISHYGSYGFTYSEAWREVSQDGKVIGAECCQHRSDQLNAWEAKTSAERITDARYVLKWTPHIADSIRHHNYPSMIEALERAKGMETTCNELAAKLRVTPEEVFLLMHMKESERKAALADMGFRRGEKKP